MVPSEPQSVSESTSERSDRGKDLPSVSIVMGSDSDLERMAEAERVLKEFGVGVEVTIASAHRSPELVREYAQGLKARGVKVVIAAAGGAAHLAGVIASLTVLPVIGVPMGPTVPAGSAALGGFGGLGVMSGLDALLSTVQMPSGVPVACVAVNGAKNAALLAVRILALCDEDLEAKLMTYMHDQSEEVKRKAEQLRDLGVEGYLAKKARVRPNGPDETSPRH